MRLALYQPEIPQNTGTLLRLGACLDVPLDIIEPCGFLLSDRGLKRAGMDYLERAQLTRHENWTAFLATQTHTHRLVLLTPHTSQSFLDFRFEDTDTLLLGQESCGVPLTIAQSLAHQVKIPLLANRRSLNMAIAGALVLGEALRQTQLFPKDILQE